MGIQISASSIIPKTTVPAEGKPPMDGENEREWDSVVKPLNDLRSFDNTPVPNAIPADIWCENDVVLTSMRRDHVASTLIQRHFGTKCPLGYNKF